MNTPSKRASAIGIGLAVRLVLPVPDAAISQGDRQTVAYSYAGVLAGALVPPPQITKAVDTQLELAAAATEVAVGYASSAADVSCRAVSTSTDVQVH